MSTLPALARRKLPIGIQNLREIREEGHYYVDKSGMAIDLIASGKAYFLSRPRRFGKSLLLDTFRHLFEGSRSLFDGLAAETRWDWSRRFPVIRLSFSGGVSMASSGPPSAGLAQRIRENLRVNREALDLPLPPGLPDDDLTGNFADLIRQAHRSRGERAVVLIDEYDKPILDHIEHPEVATVMRDGLRDLYATLKDCDEHLRFVFITGVSKFSKVSLFSGLNQLIDLTLEPACSALCGYTDADLDTVFAPELPGLDREEIRRWYNGYNWLGEPVYNPFDVLLLLRNRAFKPYWFETGTPTFLIRLLTERGQFTPGLARLTSTTDILSTFDVTTIPTETLMFQAGYLTIESMGLAPNDEEDADPEQEFITLRYPNREVRGSLNKALLRGLVGDLSLPGPQSVRLARLLRAGDMAGLRELFHAFFASIPHDWYRNSPIAQFKGYWASVFYSHFAAIGLDIRVEDTTNHGRIDMAVRAGGVVWVFEFKVVELVPEGRALQQIRDRGYADKYLGQGEPVHLVGVEFSRVGRNIVGFEVETVG